MPKKPKRGKSLPFGTNPQKKHSTPPVTVFPGKFVRKTQAVAPIPSPPVLEDDEPVEGLPNFDSLGLPETLLAAVNAAGFESPTPIQARAIPILLTGQSLIGQAQTGTGKTAAFALPLLSQMDASNRRTQALVLVPTRELAIQAAGQIHLLGKGEQLRIVPVYGGQPIDRQIHSLSQGAQVVVGTPGRVLDHLRRGSLNLSHVTFCALDEADEMLAFGFIEDLETILAELPDVRQTALFSATMPPKIAALAQKFLPNAVNIAIATKRRTVDNIAQTYYEVVPGKKLEALTRVLDMETPGSTIVFCRTRADTNFLAEELRVRGYGAEALSGEMAQTERDRVMKRFREGQADLLIATDVAARGLDIETVTHVINYELPWDVEQYIHRIGRTGRAGRAGDAISLIEPRQRRNLRQIEQATGATIKPVRLPTLADVALRRQEVFTARIRERLERGETEAHLPAVTTLADDYDPVEIAAAALALLWEETEAGKIRNSEEELNAASERAESGMARLFFGLGRRDGLRPGDIVRTIVNEANLPAKSVGAIELLDKTAFVEVPLHRVESVVVALRAVRFNGKRCTVTLDTMPAFPAKKRR